MTKTTDPNTINDFRATPEDVARWEDVSGEVEPTSDIAEFERAVLLANRCVWLDSNDREIERLQEAVSIACGLLGVDEDAIAARAEEWARLKGHI